VTDKSGLRPLTEDEIEGALQYVRSSVETIVAWRHPLGFIHAQLALVLPFSCKVRLHLWPEAQNTDELGTGTRIHNHGFDFISHVVTGTVLERRYDALRDPHGDAACFAVHNAAGKSALQDTNERYSLIESAEMNHVAGGAYRMDAGRFHDAIAIESGTITLVLAQAAPGVRSLVMAREGHKPSDTAWPPVGAAELQRILTGLRRSRTRSK
jgi:hypothetical protein